MELRGFTFSEYERILTVALAEGYHVYTIADYLRRSDVEEPFVLIRHDVDRKVDTARSMARLEADYDVAATYYLRTSTFSESFATELVEMGHEVGYHYEDYARTGGDIERAHREFAANLERFREVVPIETICSHGRLSRYHNHDMWRLDERTFDDYDLLGEAYLTVDIETTDPEKTSYFSDTGRAWGTELPEYGRTETTDDLVDALRSGSVPKAYLLVHPGRWARTKRELLERAAWDVAAETGKTVADRVKKLVP